MHAVKSDLETEDLKFNGTVENKSMMNLMHTNANDDANDDHDDDFTIL